MVLLPFCPFKRKTEDGSSLFFIRNAPEGFGLVFCSGGLRPPDFILQELSALTERRYSRITH
jgi:hypothetical protein